MTGDEDGNVTPWINTVFPESAAAFCGVDVTTVAVGEVNVPVVGTGLDHHLSRRGHRAGGVRTYLRRHHVDASAGARGFFPVSKENLLKYPMLEDAWRHGDERRHCRRTRQGPPDPGRQGTPGSRQSPPPTPPTKPPPPSTWPPSTPAWTAPMRPGRDRYGSWWAAPSTPTWPGSWSTPAPRPSYPSLRRSPPSVVACSFPGT